MSDNFAQSPPAVLPVFAHRAEILKVVRSSQVCILTGETGSGKSTGLAQILFEAGYTRTHITQPRITAATTLAEFVAQSLGQEVGRSVGYMTSLHKSFSDESKVIFITDGLQLAHEVHGNGIPDREDCVIVIDEHHERSQNIDALVAILLKRIKHGARFRIVFSSATADVKRLKAWLEPIFAQEIPHVHVNGRTFPVEEHLIHNTDVLGTTVEELMHGNNVLVFQPGVKQIEDFCEQLEKTGLDIEILPLYSALSKVDRDKVFRAYDRPKVVVATNIAQTSITIPDLDVVVDTGLERRPVVDAWGNAGLTMALTSRADCDQRKGRCGRTRPGTYYLAGTPRERRRPFPLVAMNTTNLEGLVLRLKKGGYRPESLEWLDVPDKGQLACARKRLSLLGATKGNGQLTKLGEEMVGYPLDPCYARMVCEAERRGVLPDVLVMAAVASTGGLLFDPDDERFEDKVACYESDFILMKDVFIDTFYQQRIQEPANLDRWLEDEGIKPQHYRRAMDLYLGLCDKTGTIPFEGFGPVTKEKDMLASVFTGLWPYGVWQVQGEHAVDIAGNHRQISKYSAAPQGQVVVGEPFNLHDGEGFDLYLLQRVSVVSRKIAKECLKDGFKSLPPPPVQSALQKKAATRKRKT